MEETEYALGRQCLEGPQPLTEKAQEAGSQQSNSDCLGGQAGFPPAVVNPGQTINAWASGSSSVNWGEHLPGVVGGLNELTPGNLGASCPASSEHSVSLSSHSWRWRGSPSREKSWLLSI